MSVEAKTTLYVPLDDLKLYRDHAGNLLPRSQIEQHLRSVCPEVIGVEFIDESFGAVTVTWSWKSGTREDFLKRCNRALFNYFHWLRGYIHAAQAAGVA